MTDHKPLSEGEMKRLLKRMDDVDHLLCEPECEGRCADCPQLVMHAAAEALRATPKPLDGEAERLEAIRKRLAAATQDTGLRWAYESCGEKGDGSNVIGVMFHPDDQDAKNPLQGRCDPIYDEEAREFRDYYRDEEVAEVEHRNRRSGAIAEFICHAPADIEYLLALRARSTQKEATLALDEFAGIIYRESVPDISRLVEWCGLMAETKAPWLEMASRIAAKAGLRIIKDSPGA